jgi:hypothetical protein
MRMRIKKALFLLAKAYQLFAVECEGRYQLVHASDWSGFRHIVDRHHGLPDESYGSVH